MRKIGLALILGLLFFSIGTYSQSSDDSKPTLLRLEKIIKQDVWEIPDLSNEKSFYLTRSDGIFIKSYSFIQKVPPQKFEYYSLDEKDKSLKVFSRDCALRNSESYSVNGKIYAYSFICVPIAYGDAINEKGEIVGKSMTLIGITLSFSLFDEDGDGKFETKYLTDKLPEVVPDWIKRR